MKKVDIGGGYGFGTFQGVYTPSILTIIGVVMYLRFGWMLGVWAATLSSAVGSFTRISVMDGLYRPMALTLSKAL